MTTYTVKGYQALLAQSGREVNRNAVRTMNRAAGNIKRDWRARAAVKNPVHAPKYAGAIVMRRTIVGSDGLTVTVEPRFTRHGQGSLGPVLEYGGANGSRPQMSNIEALAGELPSLLGWLSRIARDSLT